MIDLKELIEREIDQYLEWPTADKSHVTTVSAKLFAEHVARLYADHIAEARKKVSRPQIREVFLRNGAHIEPDRDDLPDYVYESVFELLEMAAPAVQGEPVGWQFYQHGEWWSGDHRIKDHRKNTEDAGFRVRDVYAAAPAVQGESVDGLLPCPFCGGYDIGNRYVETYSCDSSYDIFGCEDCGANFNNDDQTGPALWNQRVAAPAVQNEAFEALASQLLTKRAEILGRPLKWAEAIEITAIVTSMPDEEKQRLLDMDAAPDVAGLVEALECALETMENVDGANDCSRGIDAVEEALASWRQSNEEK